MKEQFVIEVNPRLEGYLDEAETYIESGQGTGNGVGAKKT